MLSLPTRKLPRSPIVLIILSVLTFGFVCTGMANHTSMHNMDMNPTRVTMSSANQQECCNTSISKNIDSWKNIILTAPDKMRDSLALLVLGLALIFGYSWLSLRNRHPSMEPDVGRLCLYIRQNPDLILFNHLKIAFARGILNPKIY